MGVLANANAARLLASCIRLSGVDVRVAGSKSHTSHIVFARLLVNRHRSHDHVEVTGVDGLSGFRDDLTTTVDDTDGRVVSLMLRISLLSVSSASSSSSSSSSSPLPPAVAHAADGDGDDDNKAPPSAPSSTASVVRHEIAEQQQQVTVSSPLPVTTALDQSGSCSPQFALHLPPSSDDQDVRPDAKRSLLSELGVGE